MDKVTHVVAKYIDKGTGKFPKFESYSYTNEDEYGKTLEIKLGRTDKQPECFGVICTLETKYDILVPRRSDQVYSFKNMFSGFGGGLPYGEPFPAFWLGRRLNEETGKKYNADLQLLGLVEDNVHNCELLSYRAFVRQIKKIPEPEKNVFGVQKYSEFVKLDKKTQLEGFLKIWRARIASTVEPSLNYALFDLKTAHRKGEKLVERMTKNIPRLDEFM